MQPLSTAIIATDAEQRLILTLQVNGTGLATVATATDVLPISMKDECLRKLVDAAPSIVLLDLSPQDARLAPQAIELILAAVPQCVVFVIGDLNQPASIISVMRAGAKEFLGRPTTTAILTEAFLRVSSQRKRVTANTGERGKVFAFLNAKGGCGSTTVAVNTAMGLLRSGSVIVVDLAILGHVALQLNLKPAFTVRDALTNLHRLDDSLLQSIIVRHSSGLHALAGGSLQPTDMDATALSTLLDVLVAAYKYVVLDVSTRLDNIGQAAADHSDEVLLIAAADVPSLWSAARIAEQMSSSRKRMRLVLNRFRKIPGLTDADVEHSTHLQVFAKVPNQYAAVATSIDRGIPVSHQNHSEISRAFTALADSLTGTAAPRKFTLAPMLLKKVENL